MLKLIKTKNKSAVLSGIVLAFAIGLFLSTNFISEKIEELIILALLAPYILLVRKDRTLHKREIYETFFYQHAIDQSCCFTMTDIEGKILYANEYFCKNSGYTLEELIGKDHKILSSGLHPKDFFEKMWATILAGKTWRGELCNRKKNGELHWLDCSIIPFTDEEGKVNRFISLRKDISDKKQLEKQFQTMVENLPAGAMLMTKKEIFFNKALTELIGYTREDVTSVDHWFQLLYRERADKIKALYHKKKLEGFKEKMVLTIYTKSGDQRTLEFSAFKDSSSEIWIANDISELVESQSRFKTLFESSADPQFLIEEKNGCPIYVDANPAALRLLDCQSKQEIMGKSPLEFSPEFQTNGKLSAELMAEQNEALHEGVVKFEWMHQRKDGSTFEVSASVLPVILGGKNCILSTCRDLTEEKIYQKKLLENSKMSSLGIMAAGIAHEINTPLAVILGNAERLRDSVDKETAELAGTLIDKIENNVERIAKLTNSLRYYAHQGDDDKQKYTNISEMLEEIRIVMTPVMKSKGIELSISYDDELNLLARPSQLRQVIINLINNSIYATENLEDRWIHIEGWRSNQEMMIKVSDSGRGIPMNIRDRIMDPFFTTKEVGKGSGLGLSVSKGIIDSHNGELYLDPNSKHTCFVIKLPMKKEAYAC